MLVKSPVAVSTSLPSGRLAAMSPANTDTWLPTATAEGSTPARWAYEARAAATGRSYATASAVPARHCASAC